MRLRSIYTAFKLSKMITRRLSHFGQTDIWGVLAILIFCMALLFSAYLFWWHTRSFASIPTSENEEENEDL